MKTALIEFLSKANMPLMPLIDALPCGVIMADSMGVICLWNDGARQQFQFTKEETIGQNVIMLMPDNFVPMHVAAMKARREAQYDERPKSVIIGNTVEVFGRRKDGTEFPIQLSITEHFIDNDPDKLCYMAVVTDLADVKMNATAKLIATQLHMLNDKVEEKIEQVEKVNACPVKIRKNKELQKDKELEKKKN